MSDARIPLRVIQEVSGHRTLDELQKYLEVRREQVRGAIAALAMLSHVEKTEITDVNLLEEILEGLLTANTMEELRQIYQHSTQE